MKIFVINNDNIIINVILCETVELAMSLVGMTCVPAIDGKWIGDSL